MLSQGHVQNHIDIVPFLSQLSYTWKGAMGLLLASLNLCDGELAAGAGLLLLALDWGLLPPATTL